jgi:hypothetical protein
MDTISKLHKPESLSLSLVIKILEFFSWQISLYTTQN